MATNGLSAQQWLNANQAQLTPAKVVKIRENILKKLQALTEDSAEIAGLIEALDVIDSWLHLATTSDSVHPEPNQQSTPDQAQVAPISNETWDLNPLVPDTSQSQQQTLSTSEKQQAFSELLKKNPYPLSNDSTSEEQS
ncbi:hypothetical protein [Zooshikella harenae]|uniref:Uncharacterized protein n=1 Tax=Zooshikella harenae TaxID=2827238 RepID=A0ABS5ZF02_9GAMM|nr:hypothetical protein [Zooshikella harenae]MBU2712641.1 hypothetical protein [Zooshikella harenae]